MFLAIVTDTNAHVPLCCTAPLLLLRVVFFFSSIPAFPRITRGPDFESVRLSLSLSLVDHEIGNSHLAIFHGGNVFHRREQLIVGA